MDASVFEKLLYKFRWQVSAVLLGMLFVGIGILVNNNLGSSPSVEIIENSRSEDSETDSTQIVVEVAGAVNKPGVYKFGLDDRVNDAIEAAGGFSTDVDESWTNRFLNKASFLEDGQKIFVPSVNQSGDKSASNFTGVLGSENGGGDSQTKYVNINTASKSQLESLWGIGHVYAQKIIEQRPYSSVEELLERGIIKQNVYDRNKDKMTVY